MEATPAPPCRPAPPSPPLAGAVERWLLDVESCIRRTLHKLAGAVTLSRSVLPM